MPHKDREKRKEYKRKWREANREREAATSKAWREANREREAARIKAWREANRERAAATGKAWREANRERAAATGKAWREANRERVAARRRASYEANREREAAAYKAWRKANPERVAATRKAWKKANPELVSEQKRKRRAKEKNATVPLTSKEKQTMLVMERTRRRLQKKTGREHSIDHIVPLDHGGIHHPCNLRVLDDSENSSKLNKITPEALALVGENYRLYYERIGPEKAEWFRDKIAAEIGLETANRLIGSERAAPPTIGTLEDLLT